MRLSFYLYVCLPCGAVNKCLTGRWINAWVEEKRKEKMNTCQMGDQEGWDRKENRAWDINVSSDLKAALLFLSQQVGSYSPLSLLTEGEIYFKAPEF